MLNKINELRTQKGSLMIEALAMLGLISMVTPVIYKKAAERTTEMQDINAASQVRVIVNSIDDYLRDNYTTITSGGTVTSQSAPADAQSVNYGTWGFGAGDDDTTTKTSDPINIEHFRDYLPLGFRPEGKIFKQFDVAIKQTRDPSGERKALTTVLVAKNNADGSVDPSFNRLRSSRIASMIGTNGGFVEGDNATGVQGVWQIPKAELPSDSVADGTIVATSIEAVADGTGGGKNVLHRVEVPGRPEYNTMETALNMGGNDVNHLVNLIAADNTINVQTQNGGDSVILHVDGEGLVDSTLKAASKNFIAESGYMQHKANLYVGQNTTPEGAAFHVDGADGSVRSASGNHTIDAGGNTRQTGYAQIASYLSALGDQFRVDNDFITNSDGPTMAFRSGPTNRIVMAAAGNNIGFMGSMSGTDYKVGIDNAGNTKISGKISALNDVHVGTDVSTSISAYSSGGKINMFADSGNMDVYGTFDAAYNTGAYGDQTEKGVYNMQLSKDKLKVGASTANTRPGYNLEVGNSAANAVKLAATTQTNRDGGSGATKHPTWNTHNLIVDSNSTHNEGSFYAGKRTSVADDATENYKNWSNYNLSLTGTTMSLQSNAYLQKLSNGVYNTKLARYNAGSNYKPVFMTGYNASAPKSKTGNYGNNYMLEVTTDQALLGHVGGASIVVNDYFDRNTQSSKSIHMGVHGDMDDFVLSPNSDTWGDGDDRTLAYMRKGQISLRSNADTTADHSKPSSLIRADRLVEAYDRGNVGRSYLTDASTGDYTGRNGNSGTQYYYYEVNPAYTSMMHDIKLSTRGGARLSDILPDFINKGIYVMDNTYYGDTNWETASVKDDFVLNGLSDCGGATKCDTSAWLGFIPTPNCPPGYMKVATITPIRFAMAQAGIPIEFSGNGGIVGGTTSSEARVLGTRKDPRGDDMSINTGSGYTKVHGTVVQVSDNAGWKIKQGSNEYTPDYWADVYNAGYTFQVSTWLNTTLKAYKHNNTTFKGWHGIMGFIYPAKDYEDYITAIGKSVGTITDTTIVWNLFPVYKEELSAIATVYCYFDRTSFQGNYVDQYLAHDAGSIAKIRDGTKVGSEGYTNYLNDEKLNYRTVW